MSENQEFERLHLDPSHMLLAVDVGNTQTVLGLYDGGASTEHWRLATDRRRTGDELGVLLGGLLDPDVVDGICLRRPSLARPRDGSGWRSDGRTRRSSWSARAWSTGIPIRYDNPREVGPDRIVNSVAARARYGAPAIVVDFGTSTNFDVVSPRGRVRRRRDRAGDRDLDGGAVRARRAARNVDFVAPPSVIGKTTVGGLQSGVVYGFAGQVDGIVARIRGELGAPLRPVVATGGLAELIAPHSDAIERSIRS